MPAPVLRDYQEKAVSECIEKIKDAPILVAPTGSGKTVMGVALAQRIGGRCLWVAHRRELIHQAANAVRDAGGECGIILAGEDEDRDAPIQIASVQTLARREKPPADLLVIDEAHHANAESYKSIVAAYPRLLGLTATPFRLDGQGLGDAGFRTIVVAAYTDELCHDGVLHNPTVFALKAPDMKGVKKVAGDYAQGEMQAAVMDAGLVGNIIENWTKRAEGRRTVIFAVGVDHAKSICDRFIEAGVKAEYLTGETPKVERDGILARLAAGVTTVVANCMVLTEGWDLPALEVAVMARPTASLNLHLQQIGRVMRACADKTGAIILDHAGNYSRHGLVTDRIEYSLEARAKRSAPAEAETPVCPECGMVNPGNPCAECGHEREATRDMNPKESDAELLPVVPGAYDDFDVRGKFWAKFFYTSRSKIMSGATYGVTGNMFDIDIDKVLDRACAMFNGRYGEWPLAVGPTLLDAKTCGPAEWEALRMRWRRKGTKGWPGSKVEWFVRKCESDARQSAEKRTVPS